MVIFDSTDRPEKIAEIIPLGETGQLGDVVEADVDHPLDASPDQTGKELLRRFLGETDGKYLGSVVNRRPGIMLSIPSPVYYSYASNPL